MRNAKIVTEFVYPPIPDRRFDWSAIDENTYDGADDSSCPIGRGATEQEAIDDLLDQICLARGADAAPNNGCRYCSADPGIACRATVTSHSLSVPAGKEIPETGKTLQERHSNHDGISGVPCRTNGDSAVTSPKCGGE